MNFGGEINSQPTILSKCPRKTQNNPSLLFFLCDVRILGEEVCFQYC